MTEKNEIPSAPIQILIIVSIVLPLAFIFLNWLPVKLLAPIIGAVLVLAIFLALYNARKKKQDKF